MLNGTKYPDGIAPRQAAARIYGEVRVRDWDKAVRELPALIQEHVRTHLRCWHLLYKNRKASAK